MLYWEERTVQAASLAPTTVTTLTRLSHLTEFYMKTGGVAGQQSSHHQLDGTYRGVHVSSDWTGVRRCVIMRGPGQQERGDRHEKTSLFSDSHHPGQQERGDCHEKTSLFSDSRHPVTPPGQSFELYDLKEEDGKKSTLSRLISKTIKRNQNQGELIIWFEVFITVTLERCWCEG